MTEPLFRRIAIVNRGEAAMRLINAVRELRGNEEYPKTVALYTPAERSAMFVREADESVELLSAGASPYLDYAALQIALITSQADAAWVGWGFVAEHPEFAELCERRNITFVGPSGDVMRRLGDKIGAKQLAEQCGVPVAPWSGGPVPDVATAREVADAIGYPLMIKATAGGGGRGIRRVDDPIDLETAFDRASTEAERSFGDPTVLMERVIDEARHVEVQIAADAAGNVWALGVRDCSLQRRNQKVIEESSSPALTWAQEKRLKDASIALARAADYVNVGTVEFLYQPETGEIAFLEVNTRLQVEHPVTEETTRFDIVKLQLQLAAGWELGPTPPQVVGHAIEARLNAEDPALGFAPSPGTVALFEVPTGPGIRVDTGVAEGDVIPPEYDAMIAKIIAWGSDRDEALRRLTRALEQTRVVISGGSTNKSFLLETIRSPEVVAGDYTTRWLDRRTSAGTHIGPGNPAVALIVAAIDGWEAAAALDRATLFSSAARGRPAVVETANEAFSCRLDGETYQLLVRQTSPSSFAVTLDGAEIEAEVEVAGRAGRMVSVGSDRHRILSSVDGVDHFVEVDGIMHRISRDDGGIVRAPSPSLIVAVGVANGDKVAKGAVLVTLESMKVETQLRAPFAGTVREVSARVNTQVDVGIPLLRLEPEIDALDVGAMSPVERVTFVGLVESVDPETELPVRDEVLSTLRALHWEVLGFERSPVTVSDLISRYQALRPSILSSNEAILSAEIDVLSAFADIAALSRNRRAGASVNDEATHNSQEFFHRFLRSLDATAEGLPAHFEDKLRAAVAHYGLTDLERSPALEKAASMILRSQVSTSSHGQDRRRLVSAILGALPNDLESNVDVTLVDSLRMVLDALVPATRVRYPRVSEAALEARYRVIDAPKIAEVRDAELQRAHRHLMYLAQNPDAVDRADHIQALVASPERVISFFADSSAPKPDADQSVDAAFEAALLEVITRRNYQRKSLERFRLGRSDQRLILTVSYREGHERSHILSASAQVESLAATITTLSEIAAKAPADDHVVMDVYLRNSGRAVTEAALVAELEASLRATPMPKSVERLTASVALSGGPVWHVTMEQADGHFVEARTIRGLHPTVAERLQLGRFEHFDLTRMPSTAATYLFSATSRSNPNDQRFYGAAEVRRFDPVRDSAGRIRVVPELEAKLGACLADLRRAMRDMDDRDRPEWNRILLYVWPVIDIPVDEFIGLANSIAPATVGLGLEDIRVRVKLDSGDGRYDEVVVRLAAPSDGAVQLSVLDVPTGPLEPLDDYSRKVQAARRRGAVYPYELIPTIHRRGGEFLEYDLDDEGSFAQVDRPAGQNTAGVVVGISLTPTVRYPEGMARVTILGDPTMALGSIAEAECRRILAAIELAVLLDVPVEWFALSSGARIAMDSGTENMDWISRVLRRIIEVTQEGLEINVIVAGINVGAQPYWNAEATMLMHTKGILVMTPDSAMVLTGKEALDVSGGVSAEDNFGIGGYDRIMGPNGQAQHWAPDLQGACDVLHRHYEFTYRAPGERFARSASSSDSVDRDIRPAPHVLEGSDLVQVGDIFSDQANPGRKKPFDIRSVMQAVIDSDHEPLERWTQMRDAENTVVYDAFLGGEAVCLLGFESRPIQRHGLLPADGPDQWTAGTLFPLSSKKAARAINAASGCRPLVVLANLSGFDGSPESLSKLQLEYGAEIGRAMVNFDGPIVFCVVSRYHGGAFVVFSTVLNDNMTVLAVEGTKASVLGGAPAAAVVFSRQVASLVAADPRVAHLQAQLAAIETGDDRRPERETREAELRVMREEVRAEKLGEVADEFDSIHSIERAREVGSIDRIISPAALRPDLIEAVTDGMARVRTKTPGAPEVPPAPETPDAPEVPPAPEIPDAPEVPPAPEIPAAPAIVAAPEEYLDVREPIPEAPPVPVAPVAHVMAPPLSFFSEAVAERTDVHEVIPPMEEWAEVSPAGTGEIIAEDPRASGDGWPAMVDVESREPRAVHVYDLAPAEAPHEPQDGLPESLSLPEPIPMDAAPEVEMEGKLPWQVDGEPEPAADPEAPQWMTRPDEPPRY